MKAIVFFGIISVFISGKKIDRPILLERQASLKAQTEVNGVPSLARSIALRVKYSASLSRNFSIHQTRMGLTFFGLQLT